MIISPDTLRGISATCLTAAFILAAPAIGKSALIFGYDADSAVSAPIPTTQGWAPKAAGSTPDGYRTGSETIGEFTGNYITFNETSNSAQGVMVHGFSSANTTDPAGWTVTAVARVVSASDVNLFGSYIRVFANGKEHMFSILNDEASGVEGVVLKNKASGSGGEPAKHLSQVVDFDVSSSYVTYQLYYDPTTATTSLFANGQLLQTEALSDLQNSWTAVDLTLEWGRATGNGSAESRWNEVRFETGYAVIPEPSTFALAGAGLVGAAMLRRRRKA